MRYSEFMTIDDLEFVTELNGTKFLIQACVVVAGERGDPVQVKIEQLVVTQANDTDERDLSELLDEKDRQQLIERTLDKAAEEYEYRLSGAATLSSPRIPNWSDL